MSVDKAALLTELGKWRAHSDVVVHAVAAGLVARIERGDFDVVAGKDKRSNE